MRALLPLSRFIDWINAKLGTLAGWAVLLSCVISAWNAMIRYAYDQSSNAWLESQWYLFTVMVMLGASYTLQKNEHVRVDIFYMRLSPRGQQWLDLIGTVVFLVPTMLLLAWLSWPLFRDAWRTQEVSTNAGGLIRWPVLILLPAGFCLVALQGISEIIKRAAALQRKIELDVHYERPVQ